MKKELKKKICIFFSFFFMSFFLCLTVTAFYVQNRQQLEYSQMEQLAMISANKSSDILIKLLYKTQVLSALVVQKDGSVSNFEEIATTILDDPAIKNVILAPDGIVKYVYPLAGNEEVMNLDYFSDLEGNNEAIQAKETGELVLGGPFSLVQGGQALVGRLPIYLTQNGKKEFWGISSVTLNYPQALNGAELEHLQTQGFAYEIWRVNPDNGERQVIAHSDYTYEKNANYVEYAMNVLNAQWFFKLSPIRSWYQFPETWIMVGAGLFISILIGLLLVHTHNLSRMKKELESIASCDPITGTLNHRGCLLQLEQCIQAKSPVKLCYFDLKLPAQLGDNYSPNAADLIAKRFVSTVIKLYTINTNSIARIGSEQFILILTKDSDPYNKKGLAAAAEEIFYKESFFFQGQEYHIKPTHNCAAYPEDGENAEELISAAEFWRKEEKDAPIR